MLNLKKYMKCFKSIEEYYRDLKRQIEPDDVIISSTPQITKYYLGRVDGFILKHYIDHLTDEYLGIPLVDTIDEMEALRNGKRQVWIIVDSSIALSTRADAHILFMLREFNRHSGDENLTTYVNFKN